MTPSPLAFLLPPKPKLPRYSFAAAMNWASRPNKAKAFATQSRALALDDLKPTKARKTALRLNTAKSHDKKRVQDKDLRDIPRCKERPDAKRTRSGAGIGAIKKFVPWC